MASVKMPFGKHRGKRLISIPSEYLTWVLTESAEVDAELRRALEHELDRRGEALPPNPEEEPAKPARGAKKEVPVEVPSVSPLGQRLTGDVRMLYRALALKYHPDRGGSTEAMQALTELHDQVQALLGKTFVAS